MAARDAKHSIAMTLRKIGDCEQSTLYAFISFKNLLDKTKMGNPCIRLPFESKNSHCPLKVFALHTIFGLLVLNHFHRYNHPH